MHNSMELLFLLPVVVAAVVALCLAALKIHLMATMGVCRSQRSMHGKTVIITGGSAGIGKQTALDLAGRGARVILGCRDLVKAEAVRREIVQTTDNEDVEVRQLDLASLHSVRSFAASVLATESKIDVLINNAGCTAPRKKWTKDGLEHQMQTNHFGHFLLTNLLLGVLLTTEDSRIVNVSSSYHSHCGRLDLSNLDFRREGTGDGLLEIYAASKTCNILFTVELARRLKAAGGSVTANALHPGAIRTEILDGHGILMGIFLFFASFFMKTPWQGAQTTIHLAVADEVAGVSGEFFANCRPGRATPAARDPQTAAQLWNVSRRLVGLDSDDRL